VEPIDRRTLSYMQHVNALPGLERSEELGLALMYQSGNRRAGQRLITANLRHVIPTALRYRHCGVAVSELIAEGNMALLLALARFEPAREVRFATYASYWIRAQVLALVLRQRSMVGGGRGHLRPTFFFRLRREHARLLALLGDTERTHERLAARWKLSATELQEILHRLEHADTSFEAPGVGMGGMRGPRSQKSLVEMWPASDRTQEEQLAHARTQTSLHALVHRAAAELDARERFILEHRLMAEPDMERSLVSIGQHFGVSRERARQLEVRVIEKLRAKLSAALGTTDLLAHLSAA